MSLLYMSKSSAAKRLLLPSATALRHLTSYSTKPPPSFPPKPQRLTNPQTLKPTQSPPPSSSSSLSDRINKPTAALIDYPKPIEIPYQSKVANSLNLIGRVKTLVQSDGDNRFSAAVVISQSNGENGSSLLIPAVFEGDLAHVVACHVKENDCVFVSGRLSTEPMRFAFKDGLGKFHIAADNVNLIEGYAKNVIEKPLVKKLVKKVDGDEDFNQKWKEALENAKVDKFSSESDWASSSVTKQSDKRNGDSSSELWRDLVKNPRQWWDYRGHKCDGLVKGKYPDFKHKESGEPLWVDSAPDWVLPGIGKLEFDVKVMRSRAVQSGGGGVERNGVVKGGDCWKGVMENPSKWYDNRLDKRNPRAPDFKHKETGEGLWLSDSPDWFLSELENLEFDVKVMRKAKPVQDGGDGVFVKKVGKGDDDSWKNLVENPGKWWDNRLDKRNPRAPDFKHKETGDGLWLSETPDWALSRLPSLKDGKRSMQAF